MLRKVFGELLAFGVKGGVKRRMKAKLWISERYGTGLREKGHIEAFDEAISIIKKGGIE